MYAFNCQLRIIHLATYLPGWYMIAVASDVNHVHMYVIRLYLEASHIFIHKNTLGNIDNYYVIVNLVMHAGSGIFVICMG